MRTDFLGSRSDGDGGPVRETLVFPERRQGCENRDMRGSVFRVSDECFCAFCRSHRVVYRKKHVSIVDVGLTLAAAALSSWIIWQDLDPRAVVIFAFGLGLAEIFILFRWRLSIACPHCGFDPVVYKKAPDKAAARVKAHMSARRMDPMSAFQPAPKLPVVVKTQSPRQPDRAEAMR